MALTAAADNGQKHLFDTPAREHGRLPSPSTPATRGAGSAASAATLAQASQSGLGAADTPASDDSISAYINHRTSSPQTEGAHSRRNNGHRQPSSPSPTPADDEDVAAASGMLSLRGSQDLSASNSSRPPRWSPNGTHDASLSRSPSTFFIVHQDEPQGAQHLGGGGDASNSGRISMKANAEQDPLLFQRHASNPSTVFTANGRLTDVDQRSYAQGDATASDFEAADATNSSLGAAEKGGDASQDDSSFFSSSGNQGDLQVGPDGKAKKRRRRTKKQEVDVLTSVYEQTAFPDADTRQRLADQLDMTTRAVSIWFQNRRQAERKRASRFGPVQSSDLASTGTPASSQSEGRSISAGTNSLQRWPSLDAFVASQGASTRGDSPASDGASSGELYEALTSERSKEFTEAAKHVAIADTSDEASGPDATIVVLEDKENVPLTRTEEAQGTSKSEDQNKRVPLRDIRDLVCGKDELPGPSDGGSPSGQDNENLPPASGEDRSLDTDENDTQPLPAASSKRAPLGRSVSANVLAANKPTLDHFVARSATRPIQVSPRSPCRLNGSKLSPRGMSRFNSLFTSRRGRASLDGKPSPSRKRPFVRSLSAHTKLPAALMHLLERQKDDEEEKMSHKDSFDTSASEQSDLLAKMRSDSSSASSSEDVLLNTLSCRAHLDEGEDEEQTLRQAAQRRLARAQAQGRDSLDKADARSALLAKPWARSVSGPANLTTLSAVANRISTAPSLDSAAGRDRLKPNPLRELGPHPLSLLLARKKALQSQTSSAVPPIADVNAEANVATTKAKKRKSDGASTVSAKARSGKKARQLSAPSADDSKVTEASVGEEEASADSSTAAAPSSSLPTDLPMPPSHAMPSFGTPRSDAGNARSFGRSISAQYSSHLGMGDDLATSSSPVTGRPMLPMYNQTPAASRHRGSAGHTNALMSASRDMTPRSLAFALGLTHNSGGYGQHTPFGSSAAGIGSTPFSQSLRYSSGRYLPGSSQRGLPPGSVTASARRESGSGAMGSSKAAPYSPLARGRSGAMLATMPTSQRKSVPERTSSGDRSGNGSGNSSDGVHSNGNGGTGQEEEKGAPIRSRLPLAKVQSQPTMGSSSQRSRLPAMGVLSRLADKENDEGVVRRSRRDVIEDEDQDNEAKAADDSGFVHPADSSFSEPQWKMPAQKTSKKRETRAGGAPGNAQGESPTRVQQRQRQHDAAEVLLGLAGEGR